MKTKKIRTGIIETEKNKQKQIIARLSEIQVRQAETIKKLVKMLNK